MNQKLYETPELEVIDLSAEGDIITASKPTLEEDILL